MPFTSLILIRLADERDDARCYASADDDDDEREQAR